jgi:flavin reductase (DIM6/NTAB) family NADH-FMN oxidoreductase RutF
LLLGAGSRVPVTKGLPVFYECKVVGHQRLGTHIILFGEVQRIRVREDVTPENPLEWCPWPDVTCNVDGT